MKKSILFIIGLLVSNNSLAVSICKNCVITGVQVDVRDKGTYLWIDGDWSSSETSCSTPTSKAFFIPEGSTLESTVISTALTAFAAKKTIGYIHGTGSCSSKSYEILNYMYIKQ